MKKLPCTVRAVDPEIWHKTVVLGPGSHKNEEVQLRVLQLVVADTASIDALKLEPGDKLLVTIEPAPKA